MDRQITPLLTEPQKILLLQPDKVMLEDTPVYIFNTGTQDVIRIELIFDAGSRFHQHPLMAALANELIDEGTNSRKSAEIAGIFDYYGAHIQTECTADYASVTLYTLAKFVNETMALLVEIINSPDYPEKELVTYIQQEKQRLMVDMEKVDYLVRKHFNDALFKGHAYGYFPNSNDFDTLKKEDILAFHNTNYKQGLNAIIVAGRVADITRKSLLQMIEQLTVKKLNPASQFSLPGDHAPVHKFVEKEGAVQNAIRIGKRLINRTNPDYPKLTVLNTILGGYFGSRLMTNIREEKGYTYGIGSGLVSLSQGGYFFITTDVGAAVYEDAVKEIYHEIVKLQEEQIPENELSLVRNYLLGSFQRSIDGPFALAERFKSILLSGLGYNYFENYLKVIKNITSEELKTLAQTYLLTSEMTEVIVGKK